MSEPAFDPDGTLGEPEKVDNTNAVHRALVEQMIADGTVDPALVVEQMFTEGRLTAVDVDAVVEKGWIGRKAAEDTIAAVVAAQETLPEAIKAVRAEPVADVPNPGKDEAVVTDAQILAAVEAIVAPAPEAG